MEQPQFESKGLSTEMHSTDGCCCWQQLLIRFAHHFTCLDQMSVALQSYIHLHAIKPQLELLSPGSASFHWQFTLSGGILWQGALDATFADSFVPATGKMVMLTIQTIQRGIRFPNHHWASANATAVRVSTTWLTIIAFLGAVFDTN